MLKSSGDITSVSVLFLSLADILPTVSLFLTIVWVTIRIWETDTVKSLSGRGEKKCESCKKQEQSKK